MHTWELLRTAATLLPHLPPIHVHSVTRVFCIAQAAAEEARGAAKRAAAARTAADLAVSRAAARSHEFYHTPPPHTSPCHVPWVGQCNRVHASPTDW